METPASSEKKTVPAARLLPLRHLLDEWDADAAARYEARKNGMPLGPVTGLKTLDAALGAALSPGLHILHGSSGVGKTAFALQVAASCGCPALYVTCEMAALELLRRITARVTGTYLGRFKTGELTPDYAQQMAREAVVKTPFLALLDATQAPAPAAQLLADAETTRALAPDNPHLLIVVDSLHSWAEGTHPDAQEYECLNAGLRALREIAARLSCPILCITERSRAAMKDGGISSGAGSRKIEYGAESVISLDRKADAKEDAAGEVAIKLSIDKNRNGAAGWHKEVRFHGALQRYEE